MSVERRSSPRLFAFLDGLDPDLRRGLLEQLRILWTHHSTAIEGNTLTLGETQFVLGEGLTIAGKPLREHEEVVGHARAIDLLTDWLGSGRPLRETDLFELHRAVQTERVLDIYAPVGRWKVEPNGAQVVVDGRLVFNDTYAYPEDVPALMQSWLALLADRRGAALERDAALVAYVDLHASFVRIHPFADGNGRLARLLANVPVLEGGLPPLVIPSTEREAYLRHLAAWQIGAGRITPDSELVSKRDPLEPFVDLCRAAWQASLELVARFHEQAEQRRAARAGPQP
jgi:Fic family protein